MDTNRLHRMQHPVKEELGALLCWVAEDIFRVTLLYDAAMVDEDDPVGYRAGKSHLVSDHHHGTTFFRQLAHHFEHLTHQLGIQRRGGLVEEHGFRVHRQRPGDGDALLLAAGELVGIRVGLLAQAHFGQES